MSTEVLHFYATGESFTNLIYMFLGEGSFDKVYEILKDGGLEDDIIRKFFLKEMKFEGDTRITGDLSLVPNDEFYPQEDLYYAVKTAIGSDGDISDLKSCLKYGQNKNIQTLLTKVYTVEWFNKTFWVKMLEEKGYKVVPGHYIGRIDNGVILRDGMIVLCGYQEHINLYPVLYRLGLASDHDWVNDYWTLHVTSSQLNGNLVNNLKYYKYGNENTNLTPQQIDTIFLQRNTLSIYGFDEETITMNLYNRTKSIENHGGKYGGLEFLRTFYPKIKTPMFSKKIFDTPNKKIFLRTSPHRSMPGLLHSQLLSGETLNDREHDAFHAKVKMGLEFKRFHSEMYKLTKQENTLHTFYQEFIEGPNGVCNYTGKGDFSWSLSKEQGAIVGGKKSDEDLSEKQYESLRSIASGLYRDLGEPIQLEFVIGPDEEVYIVQLRILTNNFERTVIGQRPPEVIASGFTFSRGVGDFDIGDVLVVDSEGDSEALLGKKALIVRDNVEFAHVLALSKVLKIPSIYGVGDVDLPDRFLITAYNKEGFISKV